MKLSACNDDASSHPGENSCMAPAIEGNAGVAANRVGVLSGGESRGPENAGRKSSGGMFGGEVTVERCVREEV